MDYEFKAFKEGFNKGMFTIVAIFDIASEDIMEKMSLDTLYNQIYELYQVWQNTIKDDKIKREESILHEKVIERSNKFKKSIIQYIENKKI